MIKYQTCRAEKHIKGEDLFECKRCGRIICEHCGYLLKTEFKTAEGEQFNSFCELCIDVINPQNEAV